MSVILEALKKVEKEKTRKRRKKNISEAILQPPESGAARSKVLLISCIVISAAVLLGTGAGITYFLSTKGEPSKSAPAAKPDVPQATNVSTVAAPPAALTAKPAEAPPSPAKAATAEAPAPPAARPAVVANPPAAASLAAVEKPPVAAGPPVARASRRPPEKIVQARRAPAETSVQDDTPRLKIDGIIWAEESEKRRALVNGSAVKEGDIVDGIRVERIDNNAVRFSGNGKKFSLSFR